jgi:iron(III) transport system ATP-binding protein
MLLDEPFSALDTGLRASTRKAVADLLQSAGITTVLVTHDQAEALSFADYIAVMDHGRILQAGPPRELYFRPRTAMIAAFLGDAVILPAALSDGWAECALGRVEIDEPGRTGSADVMIRPEQIALSDDATGATGKVVGIEFAGAISMVTLALAGGPPIVLRQPSTISAAPGTDIGIAVTGRAHAFAAAAGAAP